MEENPYEAPKAPGDRPDPAISPSWSQLGMFLFVAAAAGVIVLALLLAIGIWCLSQPKGADLPAKAVSYRL